MTDPKPARPGDLPQATHEGTTTILGIEVRTYRLDDGRSIIHADDFHKLLGVLDLSSEEELHELVSGTAERDDG